MADEGDAAVAFLHPEIRDILLDPTTDLSVISAKRVRKQLLDRDSGVAPDFVKEHKDAIDRLTANVFESVRIEVGGIPEPEPELDPDDAPPEHDDDDFLPATPAKRKRAPSEDVHMAEPSVTPPPKKQKAKEGGVRKSKSQILTDEELARQLSAELNANPSRRNGGSGGGSTSKRGASRTPKKVKKSRAEIEDDSDLSGSDAAFRKKKRKATTGGAKGGFQKELNLSPPLTELLGVDRMSRPQVVKKLWEYIRSNQLQNPNNKRQIICDGPFRAVFKIDKVDMFTMNKLLKDHLTADS